MRIRIDFHGPFRVGTGEPARGSDLPVDDDEPLPATSLKGAMRAAATGIGIDPDLVDEVFGTPAHPSPWAFDPPSWSVPDGPDTTPRRHRRARIRIDDDTGVVATGALFFLEEHWSPAAEFTIEAMDPLDEATRQRHLAVLRIAARAVHSLGADRNRGFGWVDLVPLDDQGRPHPDLDNDLRTLELDR